MAMRQSIDADTKRGFVKGMNTEWRLSKSRLESRRGETVPSPTKKLRWTEDLVLCPWVTNGEVSALTSDLGTRLGDQALEAFASSISRYAEALSGPCGTEKATEQGTSPSTAVLQFQ